MFCEWCVVRDGRVFCRERVLHEMNARSRDLGLQP